MSGLMPPFPIRGRGGLSASAQDAYDHSVEVWCTEIKSIASTLDFKVSSRGWAYILEGRGVITKALFDRSQDQINDWRKNGSLPVDICCEDEGRSTAGLENLDEPIAEDFAASWLGTVAEAHSRYTPLSFWENQPNYVEVVTEKVDLKSLFAVECARYHVPITNFSGWSDINSRVALMRRFKHWEAKGKKPILLYCGDHDPGGLQISKFVRSNLTELAGAADWSPENLTIERFGLNADFIAAQRLPWIENLITGSGKNLAEPDKNGNLPAYVRDYIERFGVRKCARPTLSSYAPGLAACCAVPPSSTTSIGTPSVTMRRNSRQHEKRRKPCCARCSPRGWGSGHDPIASTSASA